jgi:hypothetical protein
LKCLGKVEIRRYKKANVINTKSSTFNDAFSIFGSYIFGENVEKKIAMTSPVVMENMADDQVKLVFYLPKKYGIEKVPTSIINEITIEGQEERIIAIKRFFRWMSEKRIKKYEQKLTMILQGNEILTIGNFFSMGYNDPFVPPLLRRNEVGIELIDASGNEH